MGCAAAKATWSLQRYANTAAARAAAKPIVKIRTANANMRCPTGVSFSKSVICSGRFGLASIKNDSGPHKRSTVLRCIVERYYVTAVIELRCQKNYLGVVVESFGAMAPTVEMVPGSAGVAIGIKRVRWSTSASGSIADGRAETRSISLEVSSRTVVLLRKSFWGEVFQGRRRQQAPALHYAVCGVARTFLTNGASSRNARSTILS